MLFNLFPLEFMLKGILINRFHDQWDGEWRQRKGEMGIWVEMEIEKRRVNHLAQWTLLRAGVVFTLAQAPPLPCMLWLFFIEVLAPGHHLSIE